MMRQLRATREEVRRWLEVVGVRPRRHFGLDGLDLKLLPYVGTRRGVFVETGANDGIRQSNTAYLERYCGWRGVLIEPVPDLAAKCRANRPKAIVEECALVAFGFPDTTVEINYCGLMSIVTGGMGSQSAEAAHLKRGIGFLSPNERVYQVSVRVRTLTDVLDQHKLSTIDLLSLDVEGYEADVLKGLDFNRYRPKIILVEANDPPALEAVLHDKYQMVAELSHHDRLYMLREHLS